MEERFKKVTELKKRGLTNKEIANELGISIYAVTYVLSKKGKKSLLRKQAKQNADKIFEEKVLKVLPESNSLNDVCHNLGLKGVNWYYKKIKDIIKKYNIDISHFGTLKKTNVHSFAKLSDVEYFSAGTHRSGGNMLKRLIQDGHKEHKCEKCGRIEWEGHPIPLQVHHINGDHFDNRIENLQVLCSNCHSLTDTFGKKKHIEKRKKTSGKKERISVEVITENLVKEKEDLINAFKKYKSFVQVGKYYGISDNGIRKRCKKLGIIDIVRNL